MEEVKYIPGDLICWNNALCKVTSIERGLISEVVFEDGHRVNIGPIGRTHIKSIPLTVSILEDSGWKYKRVTGIDTYTFGEDIADSIIIEISRDKEFCLSVSDSSYINLKTKYVHQLQHLLFGLGLDSSLKV